MTLQVRNNKDVVVLENNDPSLPYLKTNLGVVGKLSPAAARELAYALLHEATEIDGKGFYVIVDNVGDSCNPFDVFDTQPTVVDLLWYNCIDWDYDIDKEEPMVPNGWLLKLEDGKWYRAIAYAINGTMDDEDFAELIEILYDYVDVDTLSEEYKNIIKKYVRLSKWVEC